MQDDEDEELLLLFFAVASLLDFLSAALLFVDADAEEDLDLTEFLEEDELLLFPLLFLTSNGTTRTPGRRDLEPFVVAVAVVVV